MHVVVAPESHAQRFLDTLPAAAYARAERFMSHRAADRMYGNRVDAHWLADGAGFWYSVDTRWHRAVGRRRKPPTAFVP